MIIATLPPVYQEELTETIASHPQVDVLRYNIGMNTPYTPHETLLLIKSFAEKYHKKLWLDIKGRQLRITQWAAPNYGKIILNHEINVEGSAKVHFRGSGWTNLKLASGNIIYVDPPPRQAIGAGQAVNIVGESVKISGYLTEDDKEYLIAADKIGIDAILLSFVESEDDIIAVKALIKNSSNPIPQIGLKIESKMGLDFACRYFSTAKKNDGLIFPILARDDLSNELDCPMSLIEATEKLIRLSPYSVAASKFFTSLENVNNPNVADFNDWHYLNQLGYQSFMLQDSLCLNNFLPAMTAIAVYEKYVRSKA